MLDFESLIEPMSVDEFKTEYKDKKFCVIKGNRFRRFMYSNIITWHRLSEYINNDRSVAGIQAILPNGKKLCMEKNNLYQGSKTSWAKKDYFDKKYLHTLWNNNGSIILTKASMLNRSISNIAKSIETEFKGACDAHFYCSRNSKGKSFRPHIDHDDNFLVHCIGSVQWTVCNSFENNAKDVETFKLTAGDMLYIPKGIGHSAIPLSKRISISVPLLEEKNIVPINRNFYNF